MNYTVTDDFDKATHWLAEKDDSVDHYNDVLIGKFYPVLYEQHEDEYYVVDEKGFQSMIYMVHEGKFVIMK